MWTSRNSSNPSRHADHSVTSLGSAASSRSIAKRSTMLVGVVTPKTVTDVGSA